MIADTPLGYWIWICYGVGWYHYLVSVHDSWLVSVDWMFSWYLWQQCHACVINLQIVMEYPYMIWVSLMWSYWLYLLSSHSIKLYALTLHYHIDYNCATYYNVEALCCHVVIICILISFVSHGSCLSWHYIWLLLYCHRINFVCITIVSSNITLLLSLYWSLIILIDYHHVYSFCIFNYFVFSMPLLSLYWIYNTFIVITLKDTFIHFQCIPICSYIWFHHHWFPYRFYSYNYKNIFHELILLFWNN